MRHARREAGIEEKKDEMEQLLLKLTDAGIVGVVLAVMIYDVFYLQRQILRVIENNTAAMSTLKSHCESKISGSRPESRPEGRDTSYTRTKEEIHV